MTELEPVPAQNGTLSARVQELRLDSQLSQSKTARGGGSVSWLPWLLCLIMGLAWAGVGVRAYKGGTLFGTAANATGGPDSPPPATKFNDVSNKPSSAPSNSPASSSVAGSGDILLELKGNLLPAQQLAISPIDVGGRVVDLRIVEGMLFKKGDLLARIEDVNYKAQVREAEASVSSAEERLKAAIGRKEALLPNSVRTIEKNQVINELEEAKASLERAKDEISRLNKLSGSAIAEREARQAKFDVDGAEARVRRLTATLAILNEGPRKEQIVVAEAEEKAAEAEVAVARARLDQAKWRLQNCEILAPIDGTILTKKAEVGNLVNPMAFGAGSGAICDLANLADMEVELDVPEREIGKVSVKQLAKVRSDAFPDRFYAGYIDRIMPIADDSKSVIKVRVKVVLPPTETPGKFLKPKMSVVVTLVNDTYKPQ
jgi:HlyD family secretion protein